MLIVKECRTVWNNCLRIIEEQVNEQSFSTWFKPIKPIALNEDVLTIQVPSHFFYEWLEEHYVGLLREAVLKEVGASGRLEYSIIVDNGSANSKAETVQLPGGKNRKPKGMNDGVGIRNPFDLRSLDPAQVNPQLNRNYTFETFVEGDCNRLARAAGYAIADKPGVTSFNPLMIYGGVGLGKTHLMHAIGNCVKDSGEGKVVLYVSSEKFTNQFIEALKNNNVQDFTNFYLGVDLLMIDDVQFLAGKDKTQEIFFHIFNHLHQSGKQIIMTSDCPPKDLKGLQERLVSRFKWGLTTDLLQPDFETRMAIIRKKLQTEGISIPENVAEYLAYSVDTNVRELEGVLISLIAQASLNKREVDLELAKQTLKSIVEDIDNEVGVDFIQKFIAEYYKLDLELLKAKTRKQEIVLARQLAMYFTKEFTNLSLKTIGYHFGGRDHSTVIHAIQSINDMIDTDKQFSETVRNLGGKLRSNPLR